MGHPLQSQAMEHGDTIRAAIVAEAGAGFGRIVASETAAPILLANLV
jgi:hypothetical protein